MQSRNAAFAVLCRLALRDFIEIPRNPLRWSRPAARSFSNVAPRPFHHSARHYIDQQPTQTPPQEPRKEPTQESLQELPQGAFRTAHEARPPASPKKPSYAPNRPPSIPFEKQAYEMTFTCKPCSTRSTHRISKQGYHFGSVLITCPECKNRHIISDHLGIFTDKAMTIEDLMREKGQLVKKGTLSEDGDLEFWQDGTTTSRAKKD